MGHLQPFETIRRAGVDMAGIVAAVLAQMEFRTATTVECVSPFGMM